MIGFADPSDLREHLNCEIAYLDNTDIAAETNVISTDLYEPPL